MVESEIDRLAKRDVPSHEDQLAMARAGDIEGLIKANVRWVRRLATRYPAHERTELEAAGLDGLYAAARRFDPDRGTKFMTYATHWILARMRRVVEGDVARGQIFSELTDWDPASRGPPTHAEPLPPSCSRSARTARSLGQGAGDRAPRRG